MKVPVAPGAYRNRRGVLVDQMGRAIRTVPDPPPTDRRCAGCGKPQPRRGDYCRECWVAREPAPNNDRPGGETASLPGSEQ